MKIHTGDKVIICKGSEKGKEGEVVRVLQDVNKVVISGINIRTLHKKPKAGEDRGSIEKKEMPIDLSNVMILDPKEKKRTRISHKGKGKEKNRITKKSGTALKKTVKKKRQEKEVGEIQPEEVKKDDKKAEENREV